MEDQTYRLLACRRCMPTPRLATPLAENVNVDSLKLEVIVTTRNGWLLEARMDHEIRRALLDEATVAVLKTTVCFTALGSLCAHLRQCCRVRVLLERPPLSR